MTTTRVLDVGLMACTGWLLAGTILLFWTLRDPRFLVIAAVYVLLIPFSLRMLSHNSSVRRRYAAAAALVLVGAYGTVGLAPVPGRWLRIRLEDWLMFGLFAGLVVIILFMLLLSVVIQWLEKYRENTASRI